MRRRDRTSERADNLKVGVEVVGNQRVTIYLSGGDFHAEIGDDHFREDTYDKLITKLKTTERKLRVKVSIPITHLGRKRMTPTYGREMWVNGPGVRHLTLIGRHARTGKLLAKADDGESLQLDTHNYHENYVKRLTPEQVAKWLVLDRARRDADEALSKFLKTVKLSDDLGELVDAAIAAAVDDPHEPPEPDADPRT